MLRIRLLRYFTAGPQLDPRLDLLKGTRISVEQVHLRPGKKPVRDPAADIDSRFKEMKEMFGPDYKAPNEKWDLHFPRAEATGEMTTEERVHKRQGYRKGKITAYKFIGLFVLLSCVAVWKYRIDYKEEVERVELQKAMALREKSYMFGKHTSARERRLAEIKKIEEEYKEKHGVTRSDKAV